MQKLARSQILQNIAREKKNKNYFRIKQISSGNLHEVNYGLNISMIRQHYLHHLIWYRAQKVSIMVYVGCAINFVVFHDAFNKENNAVWGLANMNSFFLLNFKHASHSLLELFINKYFPLNIPIPLCPLSPPFFPFYERNIPKFNKTFP